MPPRGDRDPNRPTPPGGRRRRRRDTSPAEEAPRYPRVPDLDGPDEPPARRSPRRRIRLPRPAIIALQLLGFVVALPLAFYLPMRDGLAYEAEVQAQRAEKVQDIKKMKYALIFNTRWIPTEITEDKPLFGAKSTAPRGAVDVKVGLFLKPLDATAVKRTNNVSFELRDAQGRKWKLTDSGFATTPGKVTQFTLTGTIPRNKFNEVRLFIVPDPNTPGVKKVPPTARFTTWNKL